MYSCLTFIHLYIQHQEISFPSPLLRFPLSDLYAKKHSTHPCQHQAALEDERGKLEQFLVAR